MIKLVDYTGGNTHPFGNMQGREARNKLLDYIESVSDRVFEISLEGIEATDASFPRESVISLVKQLRGERWFYLTGFNSVDLIDNWDYAAKAKQQSVLVWDGDVPKFIGPELNPATRQLLLYVLQHGSVTTANVAKGLSISVQNASTRLKKLASEGLVLRQEETALSGGKEFIYGSLKKSV